MRSVSGQSNTPRPQLALLLLLPVLIATVLWMMSGPEGEVLQPNPGLAESDPTEEVVTWEEAGSNEEADPRTTSSELERESLLPDLSSLPPTDFGEIHIQIVEPGGGRPVAGATVWLVNRNISEGSGILERLSLAGSVTSLLDGISERATSDVEGLVRLRYFGGDVKIAAHHRDRFVFATRDFGKDPVVVELRPALSVPVRVLDTAGEKVVGVPVSLRLAFGEDMRIDLLHTKTGADGIAWLENVGLFKEEEGLQGALHVGLPLPLRAPVETAIPIPEDEDERLAQAWSPDDPPLELVLPDCGPMEIELLDMDGRRFEQETTVFLHLKESLLEDSKKPFPAEAAQSAVSTSTGTADFPWVELGCTVVAESRFGGDAQLSQAEGPGPVHADRAGRLPLRQVPGELLIRGQLSLRPNQPLSPRRTEVTLRLDHPNRIQQHRRMVAIGEEGRFQFSTSPLNSSSPSLAHLLFELPLDGRMYLARCPLPLPQAAGLFDCGELLLTPLPLIAAGTVFGPDGEPEAGVTLEVERKLRSAENGKWRRERKWGVRTDRQGRFRIHGMAVDARYRLKASPWGRIPLSREIVPGSEDLRLELQGAGSLRGRLLLDEGLDSGKVGLVARFRNQHAPNEDDRYEMTLANPDGEEFRLYRLPFEDIELNLYWDGSKTPLLTISGLHPSEDADRLHPQLDPVDLRGLLRRIQVEAVTPGGAPIGNFRVYWNQGKGNGEAKAVGGVAEVVTGPTPLLLSVKSDGYRMQSAEVAGTEWRAVLQPAILVALEIDGTDFLPQGHRLGIFLRPTEGRYSWQNSRNLFVQEDGIVHTRLDAPGDYHMTPYLRPIDSPRETRVLESLQRTVTLGGGEDEVIPIVLTAAAVESSVPK